MELRLYLEKADKKGNNICPEKSNCCGDINLYCRRGPLETGDREGLSAEVTCEVRWLAENEEQTTTF